MPPSNSRPKSARSAAPKARGARVKAKTKPKTKVKSKAAPKAARNVTAKDKVAAAAGKARKAVAPELERLKKASAKVENRLKAVSSTVAAKLAAFEEIAEQQFTSEKNKSRITKIEKDVGRLISSADQQFGKVRGALDEELKDLKSLLDKSAEKVIPAAKERIRGLMPDDSDSGDTWEFYTDKAKKWRWRLKDSAGKALGASNKAFPSRGACVENARRLGYPGT